MQIKNTVLAQEPFCRHCYEQGIITEAKEVDHIQRLSDGGIDHPDNYQSLCKDCHKDKTRSENTTRSEIGEDGYSVGGGAG